MGRIFEALVDGRKDIIHQADSLQSAQQSHSNSTGPLQTAHANLTTTPLTLALVQAGQNAAATGAADKVLGANTARDAAELAARQLRHLAGAARLSHLDGNRLDPLTELGIADAGGGGDADELILNAAQADRAHAAIDRLNAIDQQRLNQLLAQAKSPAERAYLLKALAAGHTVDEVTTFDKLIHDHGADEQWLHDRLAPLDTSDSHDNKVSVPTPTTSNGQSWTQGPRPTCVASSTVMARVSADPIYALGLTTSNRPGDPSYDNPTAFATRLEFEQFHAYYSVAPSSQDWLNQGMSANQAEALANQYLTPSTGVHYQLAGVGSTDLDAAVASVDGGNAVPFYTTDATGGHEMLLVGHDFDQKTGEELLQVYNPWGETVWIPRKAWLNNQMNAVAPGVPVNPAGTIQKH